MTVLFGQPNIHSCFDQEKTTITAKGFSHLMFVMFVDIGYRQTCCVWCIILEHLFVSTFIDIDFFNFLITVTIQFINHVIISVDIFLHNRHFSIYQLANVAKMSHMPHCSYLKTVACHYWAHLWPSFPHQSFSVWSMLGLCIPLHSSSKVTILPT